MSTRMNQSHCQRQIEMSGSLPNRNVRIGEWAEEVNVRVNVSARGRARADAQSRCEGRGSIVIGSETPASAGVFRWGITVVNAPEQRLWAVKRGRSPGWCCPAFRIEIYSRVPVRSMLAAFHTGMPPDRAIPLMACRSAGLGGGGALRRRAGAAAGVTAGALATTSACG